MNWGLKKNFDFSLIECLSRYQERLTQKVSSSSLFSRPPQVRFEPQQAACSQCNSILKSRKTIRRKVNTLHIGGFEALHTIKQCNDCSSVYRCEQLAALVAPSCNFGYDVMVYAGKALFIEHQDINQVRGRLRDKNIAISPNEISYLGKKFIVYLAIAHRQSAGKIKRLMRAKGGYILHLDGTCDKRHEPFLVSGLDSISDMVLGNIKVPSEKSDQITPLLEQIKHLFGNPLASVQDMSAAMSAAIKEVFPKKPNFICHYHFLADTGKDLLEGDYAMIRKRLKKHGITAKLRQLARKLKEQLDEQPVLVGMVDRRMNHPNLFKPQYLGQIPLVSTYALVQWVLDGKNRGRGYGFPFDRVHAAFTERIYTAYTHIDQFKNVYLRGNWRDNKPLWKLSRYLEDVCEDKILRKAFEALQSKARVFDWFRDAMRIAPETGSKGLNSDGANEDMHAIESNIEQFRLKLTSDPQYANQAHYKKMVAQIDKYRNKLFADPILVNTPKGKVTVYPQRTNNIMERFFRDFKRGDRKKTGNISVNRMLQAMLADTPLVRNLKNPEYLNILLDGCPNLEQRFARIDSQAVREQINKAKNAPEKIPVKIKRLIAEPEFLETIAQLFKKRA